MIIRFEIDTKTINDIVLSSMRKTIDRAKHAHYTDICIRINGKDEHEQADWVKYLKEVP